MNGTKKANGRAIRAFALICAALIIALTVLIMLHAAPALIAIAGLALVIMWRRLRAIVRREMNRQRINAQARERRNSRPITRLW
jgi:uncharacterized membrane protein